LNKNILEIIGIGDYVKKDNGSRMDKENNCDQFDFTIIELKQKKKIHKYDIGSFFSNIKKKVP
jgi:hypothetical protein